jgi:hypothetical protein
MLYYLYIGLRLRLISVKISLYYFFNRLDGKLYNSIMKDINLLKDEH